MILKNGLVVDEQFKLRQLDVQILDGKIAQIGINLSGDVVWDMSGKYILPGFIDTHIHGACGVRPSDPNPDLNRMTQFEASQGITSLAITTASSEFDDLLRQIDLVKNAAKTCEGSKIIAIHAEGPFISKSRKGAMNAAYIITPDTKKLDQMLEHSEGLLKLIAVAPENEGSLDFIRYAVSKGLVVSMGHTDAEFDQANAAIAAGASQLTHTFNAMRPLNHREPGAVGAALVHEDVVCEMICDYVHLHPATVKLIYKIKGADKINIISDSGHAAGLEISEFAVDGIMRYVKDGTVRLADGTIAGSAQTLKDGVKKLLLSGFPIEDVSKMASFNPAKTLKMDKDIGSLAEGKFADIVVLNQNYDVDYTFVDGICVYQREANGGSLS